MKRQKTNPAKFDRCVKKVKAKSGAVSPYAVCTAAGTRNPAKRPYKVTKDWEFWLKDGEIYRNQRGQRGPISDTGMPANVRWESSKAHFDHYFTKGIYNPPKHDAEYYRQQAEKAAKARDEAIAKLRSIPPRTDTMYLPAGVKKRRANPAEDSAEAFAEFHGRPSEQVVTVTKEIHYHAHLAAAGKLVSLTVRSRMGEIVLEDFKGALLCFNEGRDQLFIEGGDQEIDLDQFGISARHEVQTLGAVTRIEYFTTKDHLGREGGKAVYVHDFSKPYPHLNYDVRNRQLSFSGGAYSVLPEGIDN
jgi:hypothetical protein